MTSSPEFEEPVSGFEGLIGVARCDITPPVGIYSRMWGAATHEVSEAIHRPLLADAITFSELSGGAPLVLVALDLGWWRSPEDEKFIRDYVLQQTGLGAERLMINLSHTHSGPGTSLDAQDKPGGDLIRPWLEQLGEKIVVIIKKSLVSHQRATLSWAKGSCALATNRHLPAQDGKSLLVAYNPSQPAENTLLVGRISTDSETVAVLVNYACHPTSLGWGNRKTSPDFVGAMRDCVEEQMKTGPCMFTQGASAELAPRRQMQADTEVADTNGRILGYSVCSVLEGMLPHNCSYQFSHIVESGAQLGVWNSTPQLVSQLLDAINQDINLPAKQLPTEAELRTQCSGLSEQVITERIERMIRLRRLTDDKEIVPISIWAWRLGNSFLIGTPTEAFSKLQTELRSRFPDSAIAVMNMVNGYYSYLPPKEHFDIENYEASVCLFNPGCLETTIEECAEIIQQLKHRHPTT